MILILKWVVVIVFFGVVVLLVWTWVVDHAVTQTVFASGKVSMPDGFYKGSVPGREVSWLGKKFDKASSSGINVFKEGSGGQVERYPFKTSVGAGVRNG